MGEIKIINTEEFKSIAAGYRFNLHLLTKDYFVTILLYLLKDVKGIYFKGGTALNKIFLNHPRLSEDIDYTLTSPLAEVRKQIVQKIQDSGLFGEITTDRDYREFLRLVVEYKGFGGEKDKIYIDLNERAKVILKPEEHKVKHFYEPFFPPFSVKTVALKELIAEKIRATMQRNMPRDHFDIYNIINAGLPIDFALTKTKCKDAKIEFSIPRMFKNAQTLKNRWDSDMRPLLAQDISFHSVMSKLAQHFKLKEERESMKKAKK